VNESDDGEPEYSNISKSSGVFVSELGNVSSTLNTLILSLPSLLKNTI